MISTRWGPWKDKVLSNEVSFEEISKHGYRGRLINWEMWLDGKGHVLEYGKHFHGDRVDSTRSAGIQWATRHGLKARTVVLGPPDGDNMLAMAQDLETLAEGHADVSDEQLSDELHKLAERARRLNPRFFFEIIEGLSDEQIATAKRLQRLAGDEASAEAEIARELARARGVNVANGRSDEAEPEPVLDPVAARREKLSDQSPREVVATTRPMSRKRRV